MRWIIKQKKTRTQASGNIILLLRVRREKGKTTASNSNPLMHSWMMMNISPILMDVFESYACILSMVISMSFASILQQKNGDASSWTIFISCVFPFYKLQMYCGKYLSSNWNFAWELVLLILLVCVCALSTKSRIHIFLCEHGKILMRIQLTVKYFLFASCTASFAIIWQKWWALKCGFNVIGTNDKTLHVFFPKHFFISKTIMPLKFAHIFCCCLTLISRNHARWCSTHFYSSTTINAVMGEIIVPSISLYF